MMLSIPAPSCSLMVKREYLNLVPGEDAKRVAEHTVRRLRVPDETQARGRIGDGFYHRSRAGWPTRYLVICEIKTSVLNRRN